MWCRIPAPALTASACLVATCSVALLDDAMFLVLVLAVAALTLFTYGVGRLLAAAGPSRRGRV